MVANVMSVGIFGMKTFTVAVEASLDKALPKFELVGLPDTAVSESKERVRSAMKNNGFIFPVGRITVNLSPADIRKEGPFYDLPILIALMAASGQLDVDVGNSAFVGELSLDGRINKVNGILPMIIHAKEQGLEQIFVPLENASEGCVVKGIKVYPVARVSQLIDHLTGYKPIKPVDDTLYNEYKDPRDLLPDFADVKGQYLAKRALEIAASGGHNVLMVGPPGSGKSMLAKRIPSILPEMTFEESLETTKLFSIAGVLSNNTSLIASRPFRSPHHTISAIGLSGGGRIPRPGELSLAHHGVLFLDELPEFSRQSLEVLRQPLEDGVITISRAWGTLSYPCQVMLVCAMNPCPCGYYGHPTKECTCPRGTAEKYISKISGPMLDRMDIHIEVPQVDFKGLSDDSPAESSSVIRKRVNAARQIQLSRFEGTGVTCNGKMPPELTRKVCRLDGESKNILEKSFDKMGLSARAYDKILRIARTIADLDGQESIKSEHILEAVGYRSLDRKLKSR